MTFNIIAISLSTFLTLVYPWHLYQTQKRVDIEMLRAATQAARAGFDEALSKLKPITIQQGSRAARPSLSKSFANGERVVFEAKDVRQTYDTQKERYLELLSHRDLIGMRAFVLERFPGSQAVWGDTKAPKEFSRDLWNEQYVSLIDFERLQKEAHQVFVSVAAVRSVSLQIKFTSGPEQKAVVEIIPQYTRRGEKAEIITVTTNSVREIMRGKWLYRVTKSGFKVVDWTYLDLINLDFTECSCELSALKAAGDPVPCTLK